MSTQIYDVGSGIAPKYSVVEQYDVASDTWLSKNSMPTNVARRLTAASRNDCVYTFAAIYPTTAVAGIVEVYNAISDTWASGGHLSPPLLRLLLLDPKGTISS